jgi:RHS repeat-associated protein
MISTTDPLNDMTQFAYSNGDLTRVTDPLGRVTTRASDAVSRLIQSTNPLGRSTEYQYNPLNQVTEVVDPLGNATQVTYDGNGNLTSLTDALRHGTTYIHDSMGRLSTRTDPLGHSESYQYDQNGNLTQFTDRRGVTTTNTYDALNRLAQASFGGQSAVSVTYDAADRLAQVADSITGTISRAYDGLDRLTAEMTLQGSVGYSYDNAGRRTSMSVSGQNAVSYAYDNANRVTQTAQGASSVAFGYDSDSRRTSLTLPNGVTMSNNYDAASQLLGVNYQLGNTLLGNLTYSYDLAGRWTAVGGSYAQSGLPSALASASFNADNQLTQFASSNLTYGANGNLTSDGAHTYTWDVRNQLVSISGAVSASFSYDPFGRRITNPIGAATTNYLYDGVNPVQELSGGSATANLLTGLTVDEYFQRTDASGPAYFLTDALGSTTALTGPAGNILAQYAYDPYGNTTMAGSSTNPYQFTGRENDGTGLYYYRARYYDPARGRFLSEDPVRFESAPSFYVYVSNNPASFVDPSGFEQQGAPTYDPGVWSDAGHVVTNNCYSYACNRLHPPGPPHLPQPGEDEGYNLPEKPKCLEIKIGARKDGLKNGRGGNCPSGYSRVRLYWTANFMGTGYPDYHLYRQDSNGLWSSKHAISRVGRQVASPDSDAASWGYNVFCGTMCAPNQH